MLHCWPARFVTGLLGCALLAAPVPTNAQSLRDLNLPANAPPGSVLVLGFPGGFERWDDPHRGVRKVALALRKMNLPNVYVETIENHRRELALDVIARMITPDGTPRGSAPKIILYGQSWGGAAVLHVARELAAADIKVRLTIQVDSVGFSDDLVPANVAEAANIYQHDLFGIQGRTEIRAEDPAATRILENTRRFYLLRPYDTLAPLDGSWARRTFGGSHAKMELDPAVWAHVEELILAAIKD